MGEYNHREVRCDIAAQVDVMTKLPGERKSCCVCGNHKCRPAEDERKRVGLPTMMGRGDNYEGEYED